MKTINETVEKVYGNYPEKVLQLAKEISSAHSSTG